MFWTPAASFVQKGLYMRSVKTLLDDAAKACKSDAELGRQIGKSRSQINDMRAGRAPISPETVALLCGVLELDGEECRRLVAEALVLAPKNASIAERLRRALFTWGACGVAALLTTTSDAQATATTCTTDPAFNETRVAARLAHGIHIVAGWLRTAAGRAVARFFRGGGYPRSAPGF